MSDVLEGLRPICLALPGAEEYVMVHHPAFRVAKKPFVIVGQQQEVSVNLGLFAQADLLQDGRFSRTPYLGQHGWVTIARKDWDWPELSELIMASWRRVASKKLLALL